MKIVITGVTGFRNRGVEALVRPAIEELLKIFPSANITVSTGSPEYDARRLVNDKVKFVLDYQEGYWKIKKGYSLSYLQNILKRVLKKFKINVFEAPLERVMPFDKCNLLIVSGGDVLSSDYGTNWLAHYLDPVFWAIDQEIPCFILGHSIGPFKTLAEENLWRRVHEKVTFITTREEISKEYLTKKLGCCENKVLTTADVAFLLDPSLNIAEKIFPVSNTPTIALSVSEGICAWTGKSYDLHLEKWVILSKLIIEKWNANIVFIPHVQEQWGDDRRVLNLILRKLDFDSRIRLFGEDLSAAEYKGIISKCEMVIAERMHACIAGLSTEVCTVAVGYSVKAEGIMKQVYMGSGVDYKNNLVSVDDFITDDGVFDRIALAWEKRALHKKILANAHERLSELAKRNFESIRHVMCDLNL
jgi:colanic acid/amylovoran biosynthesis protein